MFLLLKPVSFLRYIPPVAIDFTAAGREHFIDNSGDTVKSASKKPGTTKIVDTSQVTSETIKAKDHRVLVVEPYSKDLRFLYGEVLKKHTGNIDIASSFEEANHLLDKNKYKIVFADYGLNEEGLSIANNLKSNKKNSRTPVVLMTANYYLLQDTDEKSLPKGVIKLLDKVNFADSLDDIFRALELAELAKEAFKQI